MYLLLWFPCRNENICLFALQSSPRFFHISFSHTYHGYRALSALRGQSFHHLYFVSCFCLCVCVCTPRALYMKSLRHFFLYSYAFSFCSCLSLNNPFHKIFTQKLKRQFCTTRGVIIAVSMKLLTWIRTRDQKNTPMPVAEFFGPSPGAIFWVAFSFISVAIMRQDSKV